MIKKYIIGKESKGQQLYKKAKLLIPGGTQLLSKRPEMFLPEQWPSYYQKAKGASVWDLNGQEFIDMSINGVGTCILGYADPDVDNAVKKAVDAGSMCTLNAPEEVELAELLCELHSWADMVRYSRCGGEAMAVAVRIARASTGRDKIAFCGYHGWHDWYLSSNLSDDKNLDGHLLPGLEPKGVPRSLKGSALPFGYNKIEELDSIIAENENEIAAIVMEPVRHSKPEPAFLEYVRKTADRIGAVLIFDEVTAAWRMITGGSHLLYSVNPDIAVFAKAISNGYPMGAIIGTKSVMQAAQGTFISSTYWTDRIGPSAALAAINKNRKHNVPEYLTETGSRIIGGWKAAAELHNLKISISGLAPMPVFSLEYDDKKQLLITLFAQEMLKRGFLAGKGFCATFAHTDEQIKNYLAAVNDVFALISEALDKDNAEEMLNSSIAHTGFRRLA